MERHYLANIYLFRVSERKIEKRCEICSKLTINTLEWVVTNKVSPLKKKKNISRDTP